MGAIFGFSGQSDENGKKSRAMAAALSHRGVSPVRIHTSAHASAAWLSSRTGHGGIIEDNGLIIALAGRLFGDKNKTTMMELLQSYRRQGKEFIKELRGTYVLAVLDGEDICLARDGAGVRTVYYALHNGRFIFAVEPKGILAWPDFPRRLRPAAVAQYLSFSFVPGSETMLENMWELLPGHTVTFAHGRVESPPCFFAFEAQEKEEKDEREWVREFHTLHQRAVADRLPKSGTVGLFLSGGLDSSVVGSELMRQIDRPVPSWSIHFGEQYPNELEFSQAAAERIGSDHREILIQPKDFLPQLSDIIYHLDEPIGDPVAMPNYMLSAIASKEVDYVFNGEGGDPVFGGPKNIPMLVQHWYGGIERGPLFREQAYLASYCRAYDDLEDLLTPEWRSQYSSHDALEGLLTPFFQARQPENFLDKLCAINIRLKGAHLILPKVERMTGAHGLTPLSPLFDERLIELSFRMPSTLKLRQGVEKVIMKLAYKDMLPETIITRPKSGMRVPVHFWFRKDLRKYAHKILSRREVKRAGIFNPDRVQALLNYDTEHGQPRHGLKLWMLITFELWRRMIWKERW
ncbi:Asparagine synthase (Glutamine-hydrolysing) [Candidatus Electrothrix aarhusensis]